MKRILKNILQLVMISALCFTGCSSGDSGDSDFGSLEVKPGTTSEIDPVITAASALASSLDAQNEKYLLLFYAEGLSNYTDKTAYMWESGGSGKTSSISFENSAQGSFKYGKMCLYNGSEVAAGLPDIKTSFEQNLDVNLIVKNTGSGWDWQTPDLILPLSSGAKHYLVISSKTSKEKADVYALTDNLLPSISSAKMETTTEMKVSLTVKLGLEGTPSSNSFILKDNNDNVIQIADVKNYDYKDIDDRSHNFTNSIYLKLAEAIDFSNEYYLSRPGFSPDKGVKVQTGIAGKLSLSDYVYDGSDLGLTLSGNKASFKTWAPLANDVRLLLFETSASLETPDTIAPMNLDKETGIWSVSDIDVTSYKYYKFRITHGSKSNDVCDIYAKACSSDSVAAQIADISSDPKSMPDDWETEYYNPFGNTGSETKAYTDAVIYEMHIRDWSRLEVSDSTGKFLDIANGEKVINHIKNLGVTHVQILPAFDYAEKNENEKYNWGYNPYHYNVPEGRYVKNMTDGTDAVSQFRELIKAFHDAGIAVNMDVVYNHTSGTGTGSLYDMTVPYYYYRLDSEGNYSNGSGCGNETDSSAPMFRKYIIDSLKHWMIDYHINGFRFDLMGLHETETMKEIYKALSEIDKNVMVYGEPWTGGKSPVVNGVSKAKIDDCADSTYSENGVACFNDDLRNAIKGSEYPSFSKGQASSADCSVSLRNNLDGLNFTGKIGRSINYVECHDNLTLSDKLALVMNSKKKPESGNWVGVSGESDRDGIVMQGRIEELKKRDFLSACYMFLAQGTPFINGGQEFLRSKKGDENSYASDDDINEIKEAYMTEYTDVTDYYKGLIALRKAYPNNFGNCNSVNVKNLGTSGLIQKYTTTDFTVFFNADSKSYSIDSTEQVSGKIVTISNGIVEIAESETLVSSIPMLSTVIIKNK